MNISSKPLSIHNGERLYRQHDVRVERQKPVQNQEQPAKVDTRNTSATKTVNAQTVLTTKELEVLQALFSDKDDKATTFYHQSKIKNVQTGYLLDIKG